jgi:hypothetical protein
MTQTDTTRARIALICVSTIAILASCQPDSGPTPSEDGALVINELMSDNDAAWIDEAGEVSDYIEVANISANAVRLRNYALRGSSGRAFEFPDVELAAGGFLVVFADDDEDQGPLHASWKLSSQGENVQLFERASGRVVDEVELPALGLNETFSRFPSGTGEMKVCRYATPGHDNGESCSPPAPLELPDDSAWAKFTWPAGWPNAKGPLVLSELALHPARFIEVLNIGSDPVELEGYSLRLHTIGPEHASAGRARGRDGAGSRDELDRSGPCVRRCRDVVRSRWLSRRPRRLHALAGRCSALALARVVAAVALLCGGE